MGSWVRAALLIKCSAGDEYNAGALLLALSGCSKSNAPSPAPAQVPASVSPALMQEQIAAEVARQVAEQLAAEKAAATENLTKT
ncbi:hypothetical protein AGMMS49546_37010 [Spirochaetia bacterium]|nr:hypothetical protein AGMMS49546_37010 [Spirochaetia bacterium]